VRVLIWHFAGTKGNAITAEFLIARDIFLLWEYNFFGVSKFLNISAKPLFPCVKSERVSNRFVKNLYYSFSLNTD